MNLFEYIGRTAIAFFEDLGALALFCMRTLYWLIRPPVFIRQLFKQMEFIGVRSSSVVLLTGLFTGMVMSLQLYYTLAKFGSEGVLGSAVGLSLIRELGPVLTAIMITARAGSAMTAEIGIQRISEQIDALYSMRIDPLRYLISPKIAASIISFPLLTALFDMIGIIGGYFTGFGLLGVNSGAYFYRVQTSVEMIDITGGFVKSLVFSIIVSTICCYQGYFTHMRSDSYGAKSVSLSTTSAVVLSCVFILVSDYVVTSFLL